MDSKPKRQAGSRRMQFVTMGVLILVAAASSTVGATDSDRAGTATMLMPCDMFALTVTQAYAQASGKSDAAMQAGQDALAWCVPQGGVPAFTGTSINLTKNPESGILEPVFDELDGFSLPGKCYTTSPDAGTETTVCAVWCGWKVRRAVYDVGMTAVSGGLDNAPTIYGGVGCSNEGFWHMPPLGVACGGQMWSCDAIFNEGQKLQWDLAFSRPGGPSPP